MKHTFAPDMQAYLRQREKTENARHEPNPPSDEEWAEIARHERMYQLWEDGDRKTRDRGKAQA